MILLLQQDLPVQPKQVVNLRFSQKSIKKKSTHLLFEERLLKTTVASCFLYLRTLLQRRDVKIYGSI